MKEETIQRRAFLTTVLRWTTTLFGFVLVAVGVRFLLGPSGSGKRASRRRRVLPLDRVPTNRPFRATVRADRWDAYVHYPPGPIGTVWLTRQDADGVGPRVRCFQSICPHLGCGIDYASDRNAFFCPCHLSEFAIDGSRRLGPSPRDMDELAVTITKPDTDGTRWVEVEYVEFRTGVARKQPVL